MPDCLEDKEEDGGEKKRIKQLKKYLQSLGDVSHSQASSEPQSPELLKKPVASRTYSFEGSLGRPTIITPRLDSRLRTAMNLIEEEVNSDIKEEEEDTDEQQLHEFSHQVKNLVQAKLVLAQLDRSIRKDLVHRIVSKKEEPEKKVKSAEKADIEVRK